MQIHIIALFSLSVLFSVTDFLTSTFATRLGLWESNPLIRGFALLTNTGFPTAFAISKLFVICAGLSAAVIGVRSGERRVVVGAFAVLVFFAGLYLFATINNVYWISTVG